VLAIGSQPTVADRHRRLRFPTTIRARATVGAVLVVAVVLSAAALLQARVIEQHLVDAVEESAAVQAAHVANEARAGELPSTIVLADEETRFVQVLDADGAPIAASDNVETRGPVANLQPPPPNPDDDEPVGVSDHEYDYTAATYSSLPVDADGRRWRVVATGVITASGRLTVYVGSTLESVDSTTATVRRSLLIGVPLLLLVIGLVTLAVIRRSLRPVEAMRVELDEITSRDLSRRVDEPTSDDEIARLAQAMNDLLDRLESSISAERRFIGDASHELRSPLAALRAQLDVALEHPAGTDWVETVQECFASAERLESLASDLLMLAEVDAAGPASAGTIVDLAQLVAEELEHRPQLDAVRVRAILEPDVVVRGHRNQLGRLVRNLLDNAYRHATSSVTIRVSRTNDGMAVLQVTDDGAGIPVPDRDRVFERFTRLDGARARDAGGTGLGLAIVRDIARAHDGSVEITGARGADFVVRIPRHADTGLGPAGSTGRSRSQPAALVETR
jgi:signal transduction histidine kinase